MKKSLAHFPKEKQAELMLITEKIAHIVPQAELILLFGSCALRIFRNPPRYASLDTQYEFYQPRNTKYDFLPCPMCPKIARCDRKNLQGEDRVVYLKS